jgi:seryl-tRNA synthetase
MLILKDIRKNVEFFKSKIKSRYVKNSDLLFDTLLNDDENLRKNLEIQQELQNKRNLISKALGAHKDKNSIDFKGLSSNVNEVKNQINEIESAISDLREKIDKTLHSIPNIPLDDVPVADDEKGNVEIKKAGQIREFDFNPLGHDQLGEKLDLIDFETAVELAGSRFSILKKDFAKLERALVNFMLDLHTEENGYEEYNVPFLVNSKSMFGTGQLPKFRDDQFKTNNDLWLIPTGEVPLTNIVANKIVKYETLPLRYVASTQCFRLEAGSAGKDTKGIMRQHQFTKVELVSIVQPEFRKKELERLLKSAERVLELLKLPYRIMLLSSGDMGFSAEKTYDIEVWIPSQKKYREISSCSSCSTFQSNRMKARYKTIDNKNELLATLNGSGLAIGRTLIAILENYQKKDGSIEIPEVLQKYMSKKIISTEPKI